MGRCETDASPPSAVVSSPGAAAATVAATAGSGRRRRCLPPWSRDMCGSKGPSGSARLACAGSVAGCRRLRSRTTRANSADAHEAANVLIHPIVLSSTSTTAPTARPASSAVQEVAEDVVRPSTASRNLRELLKSSCLPCPGTGRALSVEAPQLVVELPVARPRSRSSSRQARTTQGRPAVGWPLGSERLAACIRLAQIVGVTLSWPNVSSTIAAPSKGET